jgi:hypothetical protein
VESSTSGVGATWIATHISPSRIAENRCTHDYFATEQHEEKLQSVHLEQRRD